MKTRNKTRNIKNKFKKYKTQKNKGKKSRKNPGKQKF
jgi:hypothetical protein